MYSRFETCGRPLFYIFLFLQNLPIERLWPEINSRVNYPIKIALVDLDNSQRIDMENEAHMFCVSYVSCLVSGFGVKRVVDSWNSHSIPGL